MKNKLNLFVLCNGLITMIAFAFGMVILFNAKDWIDIVGGVVFTLYSIFLIFVISINCNDNADNNYNKKPKKTIYEKAKETYIKKEKLTYKGIKKRIIKKMKKGENHIHFFNKDCDIINIEKIIENLNEDKDLYGIFFYLKSKDIFDISYCKEIWWEEKNDLSTNTTN